MLSERVEPLATPSLLADFATLTKPRIGSFVFLATAIGAWLGGGAAGEVLLAALSVTAVAGASCVFNMVIERDLDRLMARTRNRPLPTGRIAVRDAILFGAALGIAGTVGLALQFSVLAALLALSTLVAYALVYTPLKRVSSLNTVVGAIPGAMPPLLGYVATAGVVDGWAWSLFALLFAWQFPHFLAIAFLYRDDYQAAGMRMLSTEADSDAMVGRQAFLYASLLLPLSFLPAVRGDAGTVFTLGASILGLAFLLVAFRFARKTDRRRARTLLFASLVYLPLVLSLVLVDPAVRRFL
ncbi:MAG: heme o synthase [Planctomycetota bacterium]